MRLRDCILAAIVTLALQTVVAPASAGELAVDLVDAYQREYSILEAEKRALTKRLASVKSQARRDESRLTAGALALEDEAVELRANAEILEKQILELDEELRTSDDRAATVRDTLVRAETTLSDWGAELAVPKEPDLAAELEVFARAVELGAQTLRRAGSLHVERGEFFRDDGTAVKGQIARWGRVAAWGVADDGTAGALAPAGGGRLKLWPDSDADEARAMVEGHPPDALGLVLYESLDRPMEPKKEKTWRDVMAAGGLIGWVIFWLGVVAIALLIVRVFILFWAAIGIGSLPRRVGALVRQTRLEEARRLCGRPLGLAPGVLRAVVSELERPREVRESAASEALLRAAPHLTRFGSLIAVSAAVAPLLGLLGTVTGMIGTFDIITEHGTGDPKLLSGGISEALVTTELGLIVAIPTLLVGTWLSGAASALQRRLERGALHVLNQWDTRREPEESA